MKLIATLTVFGALAATTLQADEKSRTKTVTNSRGGSATVTKSREDGTREVDKTVTNRNGKTATIEKEAGDGSATRSKTNRRGKTRTTTVTKP
jgi:hypothetical protein